MEGLRPRHMNKSLWKYVFVFTLFDYAVVTGFVFKYGYAQKLEGSGGILLLLSSLFLSFFSIWFSRKSLVDGVSFGKKTRVILGYSLLSYLLLCVIGVVLMIG